MQTPLSSSLGLEHVQIHLWYVFFMEQSKQGIMKLAQAQRSKKKKNLPKALFALYWTSDLCTKCNELHNIFTVVSVPAKVDCLFWEIKWLSAKNYRPLGTLIWWNTKMKLWWPKTIMSVYICWRIGQGVRWFQTQIQQMLVNLFSTFMPFLFIFYFLFSTTLYWHFIYCFKAEHVTISDPRFK